MQTFPASSTRKGGDQIESLINIVGLSFSYFIKCKTFLYFGKDVSDSGILFSYLLAADIYVSVALSLKREGLCHSLTETEMLLGALPCVHLLPSPSVLAGPAVCFSDL